MHSDLVVAKWLITVVDRELSYIQSSHSAYIMQDYIIINDHESQKNRKKSIFDHPTLV